jgi:hypothetical protein
VVLKAVKARNPVCEKDSQRAAEGRFGEKHAPASSCA